MLYPTDTVYAIGCDMRVKSAIERVRQIKRVSNDKPLTFLCSSLSNISDYAHVSDSAYRIMRRLIPGPFTFLLPATKQVPKLVMEPKRRTSGIRVPNHPICQALLQALASPVISTSAHLLSPDRLAKVRDAPDHCPLPVIGVNQGLSQAELFDRLHNLVDVMIDDGEQPGYQVSTILDLTTETPQVIRQGLGWEQLAD